MTEHFYLDNGTDWREHLARPLVADDLDETGNARMFVEPDEEAKGAVAEHNAAKALSNLDTRDRGIPLLIRRFLGPRANLVDHARALRHYR